MDTITSKLDPAHKEWLETIRNWESELQAMEATNGEIVSRAETKEDQKKVEHFQNQILIQKQRLDQMKHNIKIYGGDLEKGEKELSDYNQYFDGFRNEFQQYKGQFH